MLNHIIDCFEKKYVKYLKNLKYKFKILFKNVKNNLLGIY